MSTFTSQSHNHNHSHSRQPTRAGRYGIGQHDGYQVAADDPTGTEDLRERFIRAGRNTFDLIRQVMRAAILRRGVFGRILPPVSTGAIDDSPRQIPAILSLPPERAFEFSQDSEAVDAFMEWLEAQVQAGVLETTTVPIPGQTAMSSEWVNLYLRRAYGQGVQHATQAAKAQGIIPDAIAEQTLAQIFRAPQHAEAAGLIFTRAYQELQGITTAMQTDIRRVLTDGLVQGDNPRTIARELANSVNSIGKYRATLLARTETIRAFNEAALTRYETLGVDEVAVLVEFQTANDDRVCEDCRDLEGNRYSIDNAHGIIPVHPQCRCTFIPAVR